MRATFCLDPPHIMPGRQTIRAKLARHAEQIGEFRPHIAPYAWHRRAPGEIFVGKLFDNVFAKGAFVVENVMRDAQPIRHGARVCDVVTCAARTLAPGRCTIIIELQGDADHLGPCIRSQSRHHRRIHSAAHRDDDPAL